jgi:hypothetical protein
MDLRNADIFSTTIRGVTTRTDNYTATAGQTNFTLTQTKVKNIRSLTVQSVSKQFVKDYTINWETGVITLLTGATLNDAVAINYDYTSSTDATEKIWYDLPRADINIESFPRIGMALTSSTTEPLGLGGTNHISDIIVTIFVSMPVNKVSTIAGGLGGVIDLGNILKSVRDRIRTNAKSFYSFKWITPLRTNPVIPSTNNKIIQQSDDYQIRFLVE